jgi:hypothetical protein
MRVVHEAQESNGLRTELRLAEVDRQVAAMAAQLAKVQDDMRAAAAGAGYKDWYLKLTRQRPAPDIATAGWYPDPILRHEQRWWTGKEWSQQVRDGDAESADPLAPT